MLYAARAPSQKSLTHLLNIKLPGGISQDTASPSRRSSARVYKSILEQTSVYGQLQLIQGLDLVMRYCGAEFKFKFLLQGYIDKISVGVCII